LKIEAVGNPIFNHESLIIVKRKNAITHIGAMAFGLQT
jgi:hypothetical protein